MPSKIKNVPIEEASIDAILSTPGIYTCIAVLIILNDNRVFIFHSDPTCIDLGNEDFMEYEIQKLIKDSISLFTKRENKKSSCFRSIFIIGGASNEKYKKFNSELNRMKANHSSLTSMIDELNVDALKNFIICIVYSNTTFNLYGGNADAAQGNVSHFRYNNTCRPYSITTITVSRSVLRSREKSVW
ncbi:unnamed protein product [Adineta ricciae]|uniref:Uncharacterized protein n=1 Tax=Adineta ricciae TaxID=249248 RepID=A0A815L0F5_ADIRI|nr:unnamed protein product [Adineta ricciae]